RMARSLRSLDGLWQMARTLRSLYGLWQMARSLRSLDGLWQMARSLRSLYGLWRMTRASRALYAICHMPYAIRHTLLRQNDVAVDHRLDDHERFDLRAVIGENLPPALKFLLDHRANSGDLRSGLLHDVHQCLKRLAAGEEVVDDEHTVAGEQEFRRYHQQHVAAFRRRGRGLDEDRLLHRDRLALASVYDGQLHGHAGREGRPDAGDFGGEDARGTAPLEAPGELASHLGHEDGVHLVVEDAVDLEDAPAEIAALGQDAPFELLQRVSPLRNRWRQLA